MIPLFDLHTHTVFCDGKNTAEEMVQTAIAKGCKTIGFSGHAPVMAEGDTDWCMSDDVLAAYWEEVLRLQLQYANQIEIALGMEKDYFSPKVPISVEYSIGSVHYVKKSGEWIPVDATPELICDAVTRLYGGDYLAYVRDYFDLEADVVNQTQCDIVGHFDLLTKFNERYPYINEFDPTYRRYAYEALDSLLEQNVLIEINTGAISRGWRSTPYPSDFILKRIAEKKGRVILNSDAHSTKHICFRFEEATEFARFCGLRELWVYQNKKFSPISIL